MVLGGLAREATGGADERDGGHTEHDGAEEGEAVGGDESRVWGESSGGQ